MALDDFLKSAADAAGSFFSAQAAGATANQQGQLALLQQQQQSNQAALNAQTTQRVSMYVALAVVGLVAFLMIEKRAR